MGAARISWLVLLGSAAEALGSALGLRDEIRN